MKSKFYNPQKNKLNVVCKKIFLLLCVFLSFGNVKAQTNLLDKQLKNVNQSAITSGIIYDRAAPLANLCEFNMPSEKPHNTANFRFFEQALFELHKASNYKKLLSITQLEQKISSQFKEMNVVPIAIINCPFQILNYNPINPSEGGLILRDSTFVQIEGKEPFLNGYAMVVSPLKNVMQGEKIIFKFSEDLIFNNSDIKIKSLIADFGIGNKIQIIDNGIIVKYVVAFDNFKINGDKKISFTVELFNNFIFRTNATIYTVYGNANNSTTQPVACSSNIPDTNNLIQNFELDYIQAIDSFQGLNESVALKGQIEPRVFYHNNNDNTQKTLLKPIIIVDGFDPNDGRRIDDCDCERDPNCAESNKTAGIFDANKHNSFVELMNYVDDSALPVQQLNLIEVLRLKGYDVIIVNQPSYTIQGVNVDGGADFIERNGKAFVELLKQVNTKLTANGSTEKVVIMGPSMGGQITRYALAYMEKREFEATTLADKAKWKHNTRIWVAFDSPNHGANVPLGNQALIKLLAEDSIDAQKSLNKLQSTAANEMLINYSKTIPFTLPFSGLTINLPILDNNYSNGSTISQGMSSNTGNPFLQEHYNNQFNNGLANSNGFPMNLRKLAIVNGSLSGKTFGNGYEKILDVRLFKRICLINWTIGGWSPSSCFSSKLFEAESYSMPISSNLVAHKLKLLGNSQDFYASANSIRGNLDNLPGGAINATGLLHSAITGVPAPGPRSFWEYPGDSATSFFYNHIGSTPDWETRALKPNQCFIPTYSSIGIKNPNQSWANPLNRNLVCDPNNKETYFDSYFGESENTPHVSLNIRSVNWILKELGDNVNPPVAQAPWFPIDTNALLGPAVVCKNANSTYSFSDVCKVPTDVQTWSTSSNLHIESYSDYSVEVSGYNSGSGTITATFYNGQTFTRNVTVKGVPAFHLYQSKHLTQNYYHLNLVPDYSSFSDQNVYNISWEEVGYGCGYVQNSSGFTNSLQCSTDYYCTPNTCTRTIKVRATNSCGTTENIYNVGYGGLGPADKTASINNNFYKIYPNPATNIVNIDLKNQDLKPEINSVISAQLFNMMGEIKGNIAITNNIASINTIGLPRGIYVLKINVNGIIESHQVAIE